MTKNEFVDQLSEYCEFDNDNFTVDTILKSIEGYDSLAVMSIISFIDDHFNMSLTAVQLREITDFNSLIALIGTNKFDNE